MKSDSRGTQSGGAFSLIEVVTAMGIFAGGILVILAFFPALARSTAQQRASEAAQNAAAAYVTRLRQQPMSVVCTALRSPEQIVSDDNAGGYDPAVDSSLHFASFDAAKLAGWSDPIWNQGRDPRFFQFAVIRNDELSPVERDATAGWVAFTIRVRWPASVVITTGGVATTSARIARDQQHEIFVSASLHR